jgi:hypothetical protein
MQWIHLSQYVAWLAWVRVCFGEGRGSVWAVLKGSVSSVVSALPSDDGQ